MANFYDISKQYVPNTSGNGFITKFNLTNERYDPTLEVSTSLEKIKPYTIDLNQSGKGTPSVLYSIDLSQSGKGTLSTEYNVDTNQSTNGAPSTEYNVNTNQSTNGTLSTEYNVNTNQFSNTIPFTLYTVDTTQTSTNIPANQMNIIDTTQSSTGRPSIVMPILQILPIGTLVNRQYQQPAQQESAEIGPTFKSNDGTITTNSFLSNKKYENKTINLNASPDDEQRALNARNQFKGLNSKTDILETTSNRLANKILNGATALFGLDNINSSYALKGTFETLPFSKLRPDPNLAPGATYQDFRSRLPVSSKRMDGAAAASRGSIKAGSYFSATRTLPGGAYSIFNLENTYGFPITSAAVGNDFTKRSEVATSWNPLAGTDIKDALIKAKNLKDGASFNQNTGAWVRSKNPLELTTRFTGDKVTVIDFGKRSNSSIYQWKPEGALAGALNKAEIFGSTIGETLGVGRTSDLIKFFFNGPKLYPGSTEVDDVIVFRAIINSLTDSFSANWSPVQFIGRADPNYTYQGFSRNFDIGFTVYASNRDELKPIYRKLNYLASYTAPEYSDDTLVMKAPYLRMTVGDLLVQQPIAVSSVFYTFQDAETTWETNIEQDPTNMEVPKKIDVTLSGFLITDYLPQKGGRFYTLAKEFDKEGQPKPGNNDWLSDSVPTDAKTLSFDDLSRRQQKQAEKLVKKGNKLKSKQETVETIGVKQIEYNTPTLRTL